MEFIPSASYINSNDTFSDQGNDHQAGPERPSGPLEAAHQIALITWPLCAPTLTGGTTKVTILCSLGWGHIPISQCAHVCVCSVVSDSLWPHGLQLTRLLCGFPRQEYWSGLPFPPPENHPDPGMEHGSPALIGRFFLPLSHLGSPDLDKPIVSWKCI